MAVNSRMAGRTELSLVLHNMPHQIIVPHSMLHPMSKSTGFYKAIVSHGPKALQSICNLQELLTCVFGVTGMLVNWKMKYLPRWYPWSDMKNK